MAQKARHPAGLAVSVLLLLTACSLIPLKIEQKISLWKVEHRTDGALSAELEVRSSPGEEGARFAFSDANLAFSVGITRYQLDLEVENRTQRTILFDWEKSNLVNTENFSNRLVRRGQESLLGRRGDLPGSIPGGAKVTMSVVTLGGTSSNVGMVKPLFPVDRFDKVAAGRDSEALLEKSVRVVLTLRIGETEHEYTLHCRLDEVRIDGKSVRPESAAPDRAGKPV